MLGQLKPCLVFTSARPGMREAFHRQNLQTRLLLDSPICHLTPTEPSRSRAAKSTESLNSVVQTIHSHENLHITRPKHSNIGTCKRELVRLELLPLRNAPIRDGHPIQSVAERHTGHLAPGVRASHACIQFLWKTCPHGSPKFVPNESSSRQMAPVRLP